MAERIGADKVLEPNTYNISIVGLGKLGQALADQLTGCSVKGWDIIDTGHECQTGTLYEAIEDADTIFIVVPSQHFETTVRNIIREYSNHRRWHDAVNVKLISFTKGICSGRLPIEILQRELPHNPVGVISGPMLSEELYHKQTHAMLASHNIDLFGGSEIGTRLGNIRLYSTDDVVGVTMCGIVKNIYAIGMGMLAGCSAGDNARSCFATMALNEMSQFTEDTILSYSGVGDFLTTCYSSKSRNYTYGYELANNREVDHIMSEGANNIDHVLKYSSVDLPIVSTIKSCLEARDVEPLQSFLKSYRAV